ncbi:axotactin-like isoform X4 [Eriocheir sinensis]|uniref:axotactin-like isoform X4 n=1 Tax=Eriocheir sinensis TaxID=95602 RepID=UPI0021C5D6F9|nr:axotactin-like isoform X4 [Eriocheir sinensis]
MRPLQVALAAGLLASLAVAWPLSYYEYESYGDDYYGYDAPEEPEPMPVDSETPENSHSSHHHHHHGHHNHGGAAHQMEPETLPEELGGNELGSPEDYLLEEVEGRVQDHPQGAPAIGEEARVFKAVVPVAKIPKSCTQPPDVGTCRGSFPKFYYDPASRSCLQFIYGGCRGNANVFQTAQECYEKCDPIGFSRTGGTGKDDYLMLHDGRGKTEFTFPGHDAAVRVNDASLAAFSVRNVYQMEFSFRTDTPHGLLAFLRQTSVPPELGNKMVQLYVFIRRGHLGVTHLFCHDSETFLMKKGGVQAGNWHSSLVKLDAGTGQLLLEVDGTQEIFTIDSLAKKPHYGSEEGAIFTSRLWLGGVFEEEVNREDMVGRTSNFHGCIRKVGLMSGETSETMVRHNGLRSSAYRGVKEMCRSHCTDRLRNMCSNKLACVEHFDHSTCSCFGTGKDGRRCNVPDVPILSLSNDGHVVHRLYEWMDRVHSYTNFISMEFRTRFTDSILFYASSHYPEKQYIAATFTTKGTVFVEANLGGGAVSIEVGERLDTGTWQTLTILHQHNRLQVHLNSRIHELLIPGEIRYFHLNPDFYFGSAPNLERSCGLRHDRGNQDGYTCQGGQMRYYYEPHDAECHSFNYTGCGGNDNNFRDYDSCMNTCLLPGLRSMHSFLGCMRNIFINDVSVLWELNQKNKTTRYLGPTVETPFVDTCNDRDQMILFTLSTERAHVNLSNPTPDSFKLAVSFRPTTPRGVVASGYVDILDTRSEWEIHHDETHVSFVIHDNLVHLKPNTKISIGNWQYVEVTYASRVLMKVNRKSVSENPPGPLTFHPTVMLGISPLDEYPGMVGCLRKVELGGEKVDLRSLVGTSLAHKDATYDGCRVLGPCDRPGACEHGTTCTVGDDEEIQCNCTDSGYTGKTCHFSLYKSSCEEYRHIGYNTSGVFKIDVDGNGPLPPAHVKCEFNPFTGVTTTIVENNLREKYEVRRPDLGNVKIDVQYRDFTPEMLKALVTRDETCTQKATYECRRSPLKLSTHTWFESPSDDYVTSFGSKTSGICRCREIGACDKYNVACNCDAMDGLARSDVAVFTDPKKIPLTSMVFLAYNGGLKEESEGRITLGPLKCEKEAVAEQAVSFHKTNTYVEVPAWREGSLAFSFRTTSQWAVLAYQPAYHPDHATFRIALLGEREVEFMYTFHGLEHRHSLHTTRRLNTGEWQQVLIDIHLRQLRFLVNSEQKLINVEDDANLGVLDGSMFLGGMPKNMDIWNKQLSDADRMPSLTGCIRDLTVNNELIDMDRYVRAAPIGVSSSCKTSCEPNPCQNEATCVENWGSYSCVCKNSLAHSGKHCEINPNEDAITFTTEASKLRFFMNETADVWTSRLLNSTSLLLNFRTHAQQGLILFAYDYLNNFLQLHLASPTRLVLLFNSGKQALSLPLETTVALNGGQSVQVALNRTSSSTTISILTAGVHYTATSDAGLQLLQDEDYEQFPFGDVTPLADMVYYPHSITRPGPFYKAYLGSAEDSKLDVKTDLPGFVGCLRGLQLDSSPVSLSSLLTQNPAEGVKRDCVMMCDRKPCLNGGVCKEDFQYPDSFRCDCSDTSYTGPVCNSEVAYTFHGREWLSRGSPTSPLVEGFALELAFSASTRQPKPQVVALVRSTSSENPLDYILVTVEPDGAVGVSASLLSLVPYEIISKATPKEGVNAYSGLRHVVRVEWRRSELLITVDKKELQWTRGGIPRATRTPVNPLPRGLYLGGLEAGVDDRFSDYDNFHGCISNVVVTEPEGKVFPLQEYSDHDLHITNFGLPGYGSCAGFPATPVMVMAYNNRTALKTVKGDSWRYIEAMRMPYDSPPPQAAPQRDTAMDNVVPAVAGTIILVAGLIVGVLCLKHVVKTNKSKGGKKQEAERLKEEKRKAELLEEKRLREEAMVKRAQGITDGTAVELAPLLPTQNGGTQEVVKVTEEKQEAVPLMDAPPPPPPEPSQDEAEVEDKPEVRTPKESPGDRPLSWDKSADGLPLIIGTEPEGGEEGGDSPSSEGSSFEYTIDITGTPPSSQKFPPPPDSSVCDSSPSSMRVQRGSTSMVNVDEDFSEDGEPRLLSHGSFPAEDERVAVEEPPIVPMHSHPLGDGEVQKIVKSEAEDEIVVVDDYLDDKETPKAEEPGSEEAAGEGEQQKEDNLAEAAQENGQTDSETETKTDQSFESAQEDQDDAKESGEKEADDKPAQEGEAENEQTVEGKKKAQTTDGEETKQDKKPDDKSESSSSDDDFVEVRPETEKVQDAELATSQTWQEEHKSAPTTATTTEDNQESRPTEELPIAISRNEEEEEEERVKEEEKTVGEEVEKKTDEEEKQEPEGSERDDGDKNETEKESSETQQELSGSVPASIVPKIIISSPKEEPEEYFNAGQGEEVNGEASILEDEGNEEEKESYEATLEEQHKGTQDEQEEGGRDNTENEKEKEDSTKQPEGDIGPQSKEADDVDADAVESTDKDEGLGKGSHLPHLDISQFEGHFAEANDDPASPVSDGGGIESPTYLNYVQDDFGGLDLDNLGSAAARASPGSVTPLDTISEQDESEDEKDEEKPRKISLPMLFTSKLSSGMTNLTALSGDEDAAQGRPTSEDEAQNAKEDNTNPDAEDKNAEDKNAEEKNATESESSSETETESDKEETTPDATPAASPDAARETPAEEAPVKRRRRKKGKVTRKKQSPIYLGSGGRTFSNPMSYLGGPSIQYEEEEGEGEGEEEGGRRGSRYHRDSIASITSLD